MQDTFHDFSCEPEVLLRVPSMSRKPDREMTNIAIQKESCSSSPVLGVAGFCTAFTVVGVVVDVTAGVVVFLTVVSGSVGFSVSNSPESFNFGSVTTS
ncbi:MAG: hypothetical protein IJ642_07775 [Oscillospiraceae bacterium]|nr:hypothetical protein [Oscillospiraceae bacterium]